VKTNRDALWSLVFLAGLPALFLGAMQVVALAMPDTPREPYHTALVMALALIWLAPSALWQERNSAVPNGPRKMRRRFISFAGILALLLAPGEPQLNDDLATMLLKWLPFLGVIAAMSLWELLFHVNHIRPSARRALGRRAALRVGITSLLAVPLWLIAQSTPAHALWIWLICLGVVSTVLLPETLPRHGAIRLGRGVISIGEHLSFGAALLTFLVLSGFGRPDDPDQQIAYLVISTIGIAGALTAVTLVFAWLDWRGQTPNRPHKYYRH